MTYAQIEIRFISNESRDHLIKIRRIEEKYIWDYHDENIVNHHVMYYNNPKEIVDTLHNLLHSLKWDYEPYKYVQVNAPAFPPILLNTLNIEPSINDICNLILKSLNQNPVLMSPFDVNQIVSDDESKSVQEEDIDQEGENEYDDMPSLIPMKWNSNFDDNTSNKNNDEHDEEEEEEEEEKEEEDKKEEEENDPTHGWLYSYFSS